jgi:hypothetical protein
MSSEISQNVGYDNNYDDFQHVNFIFSQDYFHDLLLIFQNLRSVDDDHEFSCLIMNEFS